MIYRLKSLMKAKLRDTVETQNGDVPHGQFLAESIIETDGVGHSGLGALLRASEHISEAHGDDASSPAQTSIARTSGSQNATRGRSATHRSGSVASVPATPEQDGYFGESSTFAFVSNVQSGSPRQQTGTNHHRNKRRHLSNTRTADTLITDTVGITPKEDTGCYELPPKHLADGLLDAYFARVHCLYPFVHEQTFRLDYERIYLLYNREGLGDSRPLSIALLNMIFAHGAEFCRSVPEDASISMAAQFVNRARQIVFAQMFGGESLELVQSLLLMCQYLQSTLELNQCWSLVGLMIRTAISIGLHTRPSQALSTIDQEIRKRVWWGCFMIDRTLSMKLGRPPSILSATAFDVDLPLNVDDQYISQDLIAPRQPDYRPSLMLFFTHTIQQGRVIEKVLHELYRPNTGGDKDTEWPPTQSATNSHVIGQTVVLDGELVSWWNKAPAHLKTKPDASDGPEFELQRNVLFLR